ncbi:MAG TPA: tetratricopeptide repeat protein [Burkholderiaceae bacterium]
MKKLRDPIREANVYLAFGRKAQAQRVLEEAAKENPARDDVLQKLAEIKRSSPAAKGLSPRQSIICFGLMIVALTLKFLHYQPWFSFAGSAIGFVAILYMVVCFASKDEG